MQNKINSNGKNEKIKEILSDRKKITEAMHRAVREAVEKHKRDGNPIAVWKDGKTVLIEADKM